MIFKYIFKAMLIMSQENVKKIVHIKFKKLYS
jgi:hypothetical protein